MRAGTLRHRCTLQAEQPIPDGMGGSRAGWVELRKLWAEITTPTGRVAVVAQQLTATVDAEIRCRPSPKLVAGRRLVTRRGTYRIEAVLPDNVNSMVRLLCSSIANP